MDVFYNYLHEVCDQFDNMAISGDFNLPDILWDSIESTSGVNELAFIETLHDHLLTQLNKKRTRGNNILDLVITSVPNRVNVTDILSPKDTAVLTDHGVFFFALIAQNLNFLWHKCQTRNFKTGKKDQLYKHQKPC